MNKVPKKPRPDIRTEILLEIFAELSDQPGRKRDKLLNTVLKMIERGVWNPGDRLPTDAEFSQLLPLSVATVQAGLKMAADQGVVVRKQKSGSFIASERHLSRDAVFFNFSRAGHSGHASVIFQSFGIEETDELGPGQAFFGSDRPLLKITRVAKVADEFLSMSNLYLADPRLRLLLDFDPVLLKDLAIRPLLQMRFGLPSVRFEWRLTIDQFPAEVCRRIGVSEGTLGQVADVEVYTVNNKKLMFQRMWIPQSDWALHVRCD